MFDIPIYLWVIIIGFLTAVIAFIVFLKTETKKWESVKESEILESGIRCRNKKCRKIFEIPAQEIDYMYQPPLVIYKCPFCGEALWEEGVRKEEEKEIEKLLARPKIEGKVTYEYDLIVNPLYTYKIREQFRREPGTKRVKSRYVKGKYHVIFYSNKMFDIDTLIEQGFVKDYTVEEREGK